MKSALEKWIEKYFKRKRRRMTGSSVNVKYVPIAPFVPRFCSERELRVSQPRVAIASLTASAMLTVVISTIT